VESVRAIAVGQRKNPQCDIAPMRSVSLEVSIAAVVVLSSNRTSARSPAPFPKCRLASGASLRLPRIHSAERHLAGSTVIVSDARCLSMTRPRVEVPVFRDREDDAA
jgi:hypothetical protein